MKKVLLPLAVLSLLSLQGCMSPGTFSNDVDNIVGNTETTINAGTKLAGDLAGAVIKLGVPITEVMMSVSNIKL